MSVEGTRQGPRNTNPCGQRGHEHRGGADSHARQRHGPSLTHRACAGTAERTCARPYQTFRAPVRRDPVAPVARLNIVAARRRIGKTPTDDYGS